MDNTLKEMIQTRDSIQKVVHRHTEDLILLTNLIDRYENSPDYECSACCQRESVDMYKLKFLSNF
jgi:hypothetical protein